MEYYSAVLLWFITNQIELEDIMLSEINERELYMLVDRIYLRKKVMNSTQ